MKIRRLASSHGVGTSLWKSQMAALGRDCVKTDDLGADCASADEGHSRLTGLDRMRSTTVSSQVAASLGPSSGSQITIASGSPSLMEVYLSKNVLLRIPGPIALSSMRAHQFSTNAMTWPR